MDQPIGEEDVPWYGLERRVERLEQYMSDIKQTLRVLEPRIIEMHAAMAPMRADIDALKFQSIKHTEDISEIKGMVSQLPNVSTTILIVLGILGTTFAGLSLAAYLLQLPTP